MKLKTKNSIVISAAIISVSFLAVFITITNARKYYADSLSDKLAITNQASKAEIENAITRAFETSLALTSSPVLKKWFKDESNEELKKMALGSLKGIMTESGYASAFAANSITGDFFVGDKFITVLSKDNPDDSWFFDALKSKKRIMLNLDYNEKLDKTMLWVNAQIPDSEGVIGIAGVGLDIDTFIKKFRDSIPSKNSRIWLTDQNGNILIASDKDTTGKNISELFKQIDPGVSEEHLKINNSDKAFVLGPYTVSEQELRGTDYSVILLAYTDEFLPTIKELGGSSLIVVLILTIVMIGLFYFIMQFTMKPISRLEEAVAGIAKGEGDLRQTLTVTKDEIGRVSREFNTFLDKLKKIIDEIKQAVQEGDSLNDNLISATTETTAAVTEITANISSIGSRMEYMDSQITELMAAVEEITATVNNFDERISRQSTMTEQSTSSITEINSSLINISRLSEEKKRSAENLLQVSHKGAENLQRTMKVFSEDVVVKMVEITEMNKVINSVAAQTNLLAMNAAIEAAHAGDAGRGFSVVADEIRKLAETASGSTVDIARILKEIQEGVSRTDENNKETTKAFGEIEKEIKEVFSAFSEITSSILNLTDATKTILESMKSLNNLASENHMDSTEINRGINQLFQGISTINNISREITDSVNELKSGAEEISKAMQQTSELANNFSISFRRIKEETNRFITDND